MSCTVDVVIHIVSLYCRTTHISYKPPHISNLHCLIVILFDQVIEQLSHGYLCCSHICCPYQSWATVCGPNSTYSYTSVSKFEIE